MHLEGAKSIFNTIPEIVRSSAGFDFLKPWFQYHYVFSQYTYPPRTTDSIIRLPENTTDKGKVSLCLHFKLAVSELFAHSG
jgi:hypothetical protein